MMSRSLRAHSAGVSHPGLVRAANEDSLALDDRSAMWVVADGMGGHANGAWASKTVADTVAGVTGVGEFDADVEALAAAIHAANAAIYAASQQNGASMGSTVVALHIGGGRFAAAWAGDSRIYLMRDRVLHRLTRDHTQVEEMVERGLLTREAATNHPMGHVLSRAVGVAELLHLDAVTDVGEPRDVFLLCSDGLHGVVSDDEIAEVLSTLAAEAACKRLIELVLSRGAPDNVTVATVTCEEATALSFGVVGERSASEAVT